jgi:hypothetical protein
VSSITERLQKLIAHERSARDIGNIAEAEAFAAKVAELLFKHNMSMSDVEIKQQEQNEDIDRERVVMGGSRAAWMEILADAVAKACFCRHMIVLGTSMQIFVGRTSDREAAGALFRHLAGCATSICNREKRSQRERNPYHDARRRQRWAHEWGKSFLLGFAMVVAQRLKAQRQELAASNEGTALVLRKDLALQKWWDDQGPKRLARATNLNMRSEEGFAAGVRAGRDISLKARAALNG